MTDINKLRLPEDCKLEDCYVVFKLSDVEEHFTPGEKQQLARLVEVQRAGREEAGKPLLKCVVVEKDWAEYEPTWKAIEARITGAQPAPSGPLIGWLDQSDIRALAYGNSVWLHPEDQGRMVPVYLAAAPEAKS